ncbi:Platinum sensitivity protein, variant 2 [Stygiomarasmius scandens]|uniref:Platinum sensitivity protein, variant 2 n=1 Tax=Marasmiellus scandens TaxID=2682957 RepID=A0ABR1K107_9AGAR
MLNDHTIYELILEDELFFDVVGMLECASSFVCKHNSTHLCADDPEFPTYKANYREFLHQSTRYHQPIHIYDPDIQRKIHHTYRLQFLKDVVLARVLDDSTFNVLNSCIIFNQIDIITHVQADDHFLLDVAKLFVDEEILHHARRNQQLQLQQQQQQQQRMGQRPLTISLQSREASPPVNGLSPKLANGALPPSTPGASSSTSAPSIMYFFAPPDDVLGEEQITHRQQVVFLIQQLCIMGKNVQLPARMALFRSLVDRGILFAVQWALSRPEKDITSKPVISAGGEVLAALLDHDVNGVRGHVLRQIIVIEKERGVGTKGADKAETIMELCCKIMAQSRDMAIQNQVGDALRVWLDLPLGGGDIVSAMGTEASQALASKFGRKDDPGTERFMNYFYQECVKILFSPFSELQEWKNFSDPVLPLTREQTNRYVYLCDLLYNFTLQHQHRSVFFVMSTNIVLRVATLLKAKDKHLRHAAFRFFRLLLKLNNQNIHSQIMKHDILKPILDLTLRESRRDNLLSCSCQEYFEHMRRENMKDLIKFCMTKHEEEIKALAKSPLGGQRFQMFIRRWEMNNEPLPVEMKDKPIDPRWPVQSRALDAEEEDYFNGEDDDDFIPSISHHWPRTNGPSPLQHGNNNNLKRKRRMAVAGPLASRGIRPQNNQNHAPQMRTLGPLVDYDDEEEAGGASPDGKDKDKDKDKEDAPPSSPKLSHRQVGSGSPNGLAPKRLGSEEEEDDDDDDDERDNMLEALVNSRPQSPAPGLMASLDELGPMRPGEKRRRDEEDEDEELLERLSRSAKKPDLGDGKAKEASAVRVKPNEEPKKLKLKLISSKAASIASSTPSTSPSPVPSEPGAKDGDTG